jgi:CitB family two-component system response regulator MalR/two-component system response regulator DctR
MIKAIIVEDDPMVAQINKQYLTEFRDIEVQGLFGNGSDAISFLMENTVDLIILDITMPVLDGLEFAKTIRENRINSDIIVVTAANDIEHLDEMLRYGVIDYLVKPFNRDRFNKAINKFLKKSNLFSRHNVLQQEEIDSIFSAKMSNHKEYEKGIQVATLEKIKNYIENAKMTSFSCDILAVELNLSKVTIRRYLNYLVEDDYLINTVDYETGGRPSIIYKVKQNQF